MLTRGHLIGQLVDDLADIAAQAKRRARLHLFDIHTHVEDFAKEVLNRALGLNLVNLNAERSNNSGLDLGDPAKGWAFQVTADKSTAKVRETLEAIGADQRAAYKNIRILVIGEKQGSYTFNGAQFADFSFTPEMVLDFDDVCKSIMTLSIDALVDLAGYVSRETRRVRIELEIPDENGRFPTDIDALIEALPSPRSSDGAKITTYSEVQAMPIDQEVAKAALAQLSARLARLPRLTREVFKFLVERRDDATMGMTDDFKISDPKLRRIYHGEDLNGDLALLDEAELLSLVEPDERGEVANWRIYFPGRDVAFHHLFADYAKARNIDLRKPLVILDFSDF